MDERNKVKVGDFVKWYELYGDVHIVKCHGFGFVLKEINYYQTKMFEVYRIKQKDKKKFRYFEVEKTKELKKNERS